MRASLEFPFDSYYYFVFNKHYSTYHAALNMPANLENSAVATGLQKVSFPSNP